MFKILYFLFISANALKLKKNNIYIKCSPLLNNNNKLNDYMDLMRTKSILPTVLLNIGSGFISNPSFNIVLNQQFNVFTLDTILIMLSSMVINDIYDINIDKINNKNRPLITEKISINEAKILYILLLGISELLSLTYLNNYYQNIIHLIIVSLYLYTPIFKKIPLIKNIYCSLIISSVTYLSGNIFNLSSLLLIYSAVIFLGSLISELLLDIKDYEGDKINNINTLPVLINKLPTYNIIQVILSFLFAITITLLDTICNFYYSSNIVFLIDSINFMILFPLFINLYNIKKDNFSKETINIYMIESNTVLFLISLFYGLISYLIN
jgi:4-hydroxybenzoate polyprenyltransferase